MSEVTPLPIAVFLSGGGRTLENLLVHRDQHGLPIDVRLVISSRGDVRGVEIAKDAGIETLVVRKRDFDEAGYCDAMFEPVRQCGAKYVIMAGFLKHVMIPDDFENRVINIHPSLLPAFGGQGMYGHNVHEAAIKRGVTISGCTVHFVDNHYDNGPIILQRACDVLPSDTPDQLAARVFEQECDALPAAIRTLIPAGV
ncbi:phosphoribosylglycinamide formyltransferase [Rhodopirellula sp. MGV]|uniref:phosphoribosylglycinamide formyltransferase n=1 Tax=Rhodopirellula sp. MGV TaxID=2023130 RepID=UPI000B9756F2|nr:phosphoribosylglycinamide formyltransferase [Rhodopirellula sp. MGV]OYP34081.1 phosphoribosylglycinamide formyltransferase [Rhodopirellula sp. MGV]PNY38024.1 phosphoribosylglycinamide formyltransferase [Rhodopirellula baltica]